MEYLCIGYFYVSFEGCLYTHQYHSRHYCNKHRYQWGWFLEFFSFVSTKTKTIALYFTEAKSKYIFIMSIRFQRYFSKALSIFFTPSSHFLQSKVMSIVNFTWYCYTLDIFMLINNWFLCKVFLGDKKNKRGWIGNIYLVLIRD